MEIQDLMLIGPQAGQPEGLASSSPEEDGSTKGFKDFMVQANSGSGDSGNNHHALSDESQQVESQDELTVRGNPSSQISKEDQAKGEPTVDAQISSFSPSAELSEEHIIVDPSLMLEVVPGLDPDSEGVEDVLASQGKSNVFQNDLPYGKEPVNIKTASENIPVAPQGQNVLPVQNEVAALAKDIRGDAAVENEIASQAPKAVPVQNEVAALAKEFQGNVKAENEFPSQVPNAKPVQNEVPSLARELQENAVSENRVTPQAPNAKPVQNEVASLAREFQGNTINDYETNPHGPKVIPDQNKAAPPILPGNEQTVNGKAMKEVLSPSNATQDVADESIVSVEGEDPAMLKGDQLADGKELRGSRETKGDRVGNTKEFVADAAGEKSIPRANVSDREGLSGLNSKPVMEMTGQQMETALGDDGGDAAQANLMDRGTTTLKPLQRTEQGGFRLTEGAHLKAKGENSEVEISRFSINRSSNEVKMNVNPPSLGKLKIELSLQENQLKAVFHTDSQAVKAVLDDNMHNLRDSLANREMNLESFDVLADDRGRGKEEHDDVEEQWTVEEKDDMESQHSQVTEDNEPREKYLARMEGLSVFV